MRGWWLHPFRWPCFWRGCKPVATADYVYCARCLHVWPLREEAHS